MHIPRLSVVGVPEVLTAAALAGRRKQLGEQLECRGARVSLVDAA